MAVPATVATVTEERFGVRQVAQVVPSSKKPSRDEYIATTLGSPGITQSLKDGDVDGAFMNGLLRRQWPRVTYSDYGYKSFGAFVQNGCGLSIFHPNMTQKVQLQTTDTPTFQARSRAP